MARDLVIWLVVAVWLLAGATGWGVWCGLAWRGLLRDIGRMIWGVNRVGS